MADPLRHYFAAYQTAHDRADAENTCAGCGRPSSDAVHLPPGDTDAMNAAIRAASPHPEPQRTPEQDARAVERAARRNRARGASRGG